jgi:MSHA biogenesis protein MshO
MTTQRGFTLIEMIIAMVLTGIVAGVVAVFIARPVQGYVDTARRAELTDMADLALKRMALEIRTAVPNSIPRSAASTTSIEFIPAYTGGRYCSDLDTCPTTNGDLDFGTADAGGNSFDVLGPGLTLTAGSHIVVYNTQQCANAGCNAVPPCTGLDAYEGCNRRLLTTAAASGVTSLAFSASDSPLPLASPSNRFQLVPATGPVIFRCIGNQLLRYTGYGFDHDTTGVTGNVLAQANGPGDSLTCAFRYTDVSATNGLVTLELILTRSGETVTLANQIHVDNMP